MTDCTCPSCGQAISGWKIHGQVIAGIRTVSESNRRGSWQAHAKREKGQRTTMALVMNSIKRVPRSAKVLVKIVRIAPRVLDRDNLAGCTKHIRDGISDWLGGKGDRESDSLTWLVDQEKGKPKEYAVRVEVWIQ